MNSLTPALDGLASMVGTTLPSLLWGIGWRAVFGGFLGLFAAIGVLGVVRRRGWLRREPPVWRAFARLHYPLCVLVLMAGGCGAGAVRGAEARVNRVVDEQVRPALAGWLPSLHALLVETLPARALDEPMSAAEAAQRLMQKLYSPATSDGALEQARARAVNWVTLNLGKWVVTAAVTGMAAYGAGRAGDTLGLTPETIRFTARTIADMDLSRVDENLAQIVLDALRHQLDALFTHAYVTVGLAVGIATALAVLELVAYAIWRRRRAVTPGAAVAGT
jgi:hypothetical protein